MRRIVSAPATLLDELRALYPDSSNTTLRQLLQSRRVRVNGGIEVNARELLESGDRIEVTADFTPDPGLMVAAATLVVGIVRQVMSWPTYDLSLLQKLPIPVIAGVVPGKHTTRKGWLTKSDVMNCLPLAQIEKALQAKRG